MSYHTSGEAGDSMLRLLLRRELSQVQSFTKHRGKLNRHIHMLEKSLATSGCSHQLNWFELPQDDLLVNM